MKENLVETLVGFVVITIAGLFIAYGYSVTERGETDGITISAAFDRIDGVTLGSDVRLSGIKVGSVIGLDIDKQNFQAVVDMRVRTDIALPEDTGAKITSDGLLGGNYISLTPGGSEDNLEDGGEILYTQGSVDLISLVGQALFNADNTNGDAQ